MKRGLLALAILVLPFGVVIAGIVAAYRYVFAKRDDTLTDETIRRIRTAHEQDMRSRELDEQLVRTPRTVVEGPTSDYTRGVGR